MEITSAKITSLVIAAIYVVASFGLLGIDSGIGRRLVVMAPLALIWFPEELASLKSGPGMREFDRESPEWAIVGLGWISLIAALARLALQTFAGGGLEARRSEGRLALVQGNAVVVAVGRA